jgi:dTDP-4-dehydrorhamnose 3,5-epimerase
MKFETLSLHGLYLIHYNAFRDERGSFKRIFCTDDCADILGNRKIAQINHSSNPKVGTVRGMHLQTPPHAELKIIQCIRGRVLDIAVDLRAGSETFLKYQAVELSADDDKAIIIPEGFAHGFQVLEPDSHLLYFHTAAYAPDTGMTINPMDPAINIQWPLPVTNMSDKDKNTPYLTQDFKGLSL